jgi:hypothetical protein
MPFELGLDLGCRRFGTSYQTGKISLILDIGPHRYEKFISDVKGQDITARGKTVQKIIEVVRDWLRNELDPRIVIIPSGENIFARYSAFQIALPSICTKLRWNPKKLKFPDFSFAIATWIKANPIT